MNFLGESIFAEFLVLWELPHFANLDFLQTLSSWDCVVA